MSTYAIAVHAEFLLSSFTRSLRARNLSERTVDTYTESLRQFADSCQARYANPIRQRLQGARGVVHRGSPRKVKASHGQQPLPGIADLLRLARGRRE